MTNWADEIKWIIWTKNLNAFLKAFFEDEGQTSFPLQLSKKTIQYTLICYAFSCPKGRFEINGLQKKEQ